MLKFLELKGKKILLHDNILGYVENALINFKYKRINMVIIKPINDKGIMYLSNIKNVYLEKDYAFFKNNPYTVNLASIKKMEDFLITNIYGKSVYDRKTKEIGSVVDFIFDESTGEIKAIVVSLGFFDDILTGRKVIMIKNSDELHIDGAVVDGSDFEIINEISLKFF